MASKIEVDVALTLRAAIRRMREALGGEVDDVEEWLLGVVCGTRGRADKCEVCGTRDKRLESHHVVGRKHNPRIVSVCTVCHDALTSRQKVWDARWLRPNTDPSLAKAFFLLGLRDVLALKGERSPEGWCSKMADALNEEICPLLRRDSFG